MIRKPRSVTVTLTCGLFVAAVEDKDTALTGGTANILAAAKAKTTAKNKKKAANRAMFPNMTIANRQTPVEEIDELVYLHKQIRGKLNLHLLLWQRKSVITCRLYGS